MEITTLTATETRSRSVVVTTLAIVGFIALITLGILGAIYSSRYVPATLSRLGAAAVSFSERFIPAEKDPALEVVTATTTLPILGTTESTTTASTTLAVATASVTPVRTPGPRTTTVVSSAAATLYGSPDLAVTNVTAGYLNTDASDSFVAATVVPAGKRGALSFTIVNNGTNVASPWVFTAQSPSLSFTFTSPVQQSLRPGDRIEYVLGFDQVGAGTSATLSILADSSNVLTESNEGNNIAAKTVYGQN